MWRSIFHGVCIGFMVAGGAFWIAALVASHYYHKDLPSYGIAKCQWVATTDDGEPVWSCTQP